MCIDNIVIRVADVARAADFYGRLLGGIPVGHPNDDAAIFDFVTATIELVRYDGGAESTWLDDDINRGFRHLAFKVADIQPYIDLFATEGVRHRSGPWDVTSEMRIVFYFDPDGTAFELVQGNVPYHEIHDAERVAIERARPVPTRPRFDHVAHTVASKDAAIEYYVALGFRHTGTLIVPADARGFRMDYLAAGDTMVEIFSFDQPTVPSRQRADTYGFAAAVFSGNPSGTIVGDLPDGRTIISDPDDLPVMGPSQTTSHPAGRLGLRAVT